MVTVIEKVEERNRAAEYLAAWFRSLREDVPAVRILIINELSGEKTDKRTICWETQQYAVVLLADDAIQLCLVYQ
ncbi:MAG TPA: hypothetical protein VN611_05825 [Patescibacteria group bacterium]|nr:hypothetical protein [Patescibacteria group bacterium]